MSSQVTSSAPRIVFIDFDGTYASHGVVPPAHVTAVRGARERGHQVLLCTGRPRSMVPPEVLDGVFDGMVGAAGGYVELDGEVLADTRFPAGLGAQLVQLLDAAEALYVLEAPRESYARTGTVARLGALLDAAVKSERGPSDILANVVERADLSATRFGKATCFTSARPLTEVADEIGEAIALLPSSLPDLGDGAGEFYLPDVDKSVGIRVVTTHLGIGTESVVAIGDGWNDLEMVAHAGTGVVIEGAPPELLAHADHVVPGPTEDGLVTAFRLLGLT